MQLSQVLRVDTNLVCCYSIIVSILHFISLSQDPHDQRSLESSFPLFSAQATFLEHLKSPP